MALTREDMFRELELLPVWQARQPAPIDSVSVDKRVEKAEPIEKVEPTKQAESGLVVEKTPEMPHLEEIAAPVKQKIDVPWVLAFQVADDQLQAGRALVQNIVKAMRLPQGEYVVLSDTDVLQKYQADCVILFGQPIADAVLEEVRAPIANLRGKAHIKAETGATQHWVTESIDAMLANASLKAQVWQDLQKVLTAVSQA